MSAIRTRQDVRMVEEFEELDFSAYTTNQGNTDGAAMGRTPGQGSYAWGLNTQRHIDVRTFNATQAATYANLVLEPDFSHAPNNGAPNIWAGTVQGAISVSPHTMVVTNTSKANNFLTVTAPTPATNSQVGVSIELGSTLIFGSPVQQGQHVAVSVLVGATAAFQSIEVTLEDIHGGAGQQSQGVQFTNPGDTGWISLNWTPTANAPNAYLAVYLPTAGAGETFLLYKAIASIVPTSSTQVVYFDGDRYGYQWQGTPGQSISQSNPSAYKNPENWVQTASTNAGAGFGVQPALNNRLGAHVFFEFTGSNTWSSTTAPMDLTQIGPNANLVLAVPRVPNINIPAQLQVASLGSCSLTLTDSGGNSWTLPFSKTQTLQTLDNVNYWAQWPLSSAPGTIDLTSITTVTFTIAATAQNIPADVYLQALRVVDPNWVPKDVDIDNWNGALRQCIPLDGNTSPVPGNMALPPVWRSGSLPGTDDPRPVNGTWAIVFNTGSQTSNNYFELHLRNVDGVDQTQLALNNMTQIQISSGQAQPNLATQTELGRSLGDFEGKGVGSLESLSMVGMDEIAANISQSWLSFQIGWGLSHGIVVTRSWGGVTDYVWSGPSYAPSTYYMALVDLTDTSAQVQIYGLDQATFAVGKLLFDSGSIQDSYRFIRRPGRVGWKAFLSDGDASVRSVRPESLVFAEYQSAPLNSFTPVQGAHVFTHFAPRIQLWSSWSPVGTPGVTPDSQRTTTGQSTRVDVTQTSTSGQGVVSNVLTPVEDPISGVINWAASEISFDIWFPSAALNAGGEISLLLISQDGNRVPLAMPRIIPDQWQEVTCFAPDGLQSGRYQLSILYTGGVVATFWIDNVNVLERTVVWSARANQTDPWVDFRDEVSSNTAGVLFTSRGTQLQVRAQATRQDASVIGSPKVAPVYAELGNMVWPDSTYASPNVVYQNLGLVNTNSVLFNPIVAYPTFKVSASPAHGSPTTFDGSASFAFDASRNSFSDPSFENYVTGVNDWFTGGSNTVAPSTTHARSGTQSLQITYGSALAPAAFSNNDDAGFLDIGETHTIGAWVYIPNTWTGGNIYVYNSGSANVYTYQNLSNPSLTNQWQFISAVFYGPVHAYGYNLSVGITVAPGVGQSIWIDDVWDMAGDARTARIVSWVWDFGDGSVGSGPVVNHTYASAGTYSATLTIIDTWGGETSYTTTVSVS